MSKKTILEIIDDLSSSMPEGDVAPIEYDRYFHKFLSGMHKITDVTGPLDPFLDGTLREIFKSDYKYCGGAPSSYNTIQALQYNTYNGLKDFLILLREWVETGYTEGRLPVQQQLRGPQEAIQNVNSSHTKYDQHWMMCGTSDVELCIESEEIRKGRKIVPCKTAKSEIQKSRAKGLRVLQLFLDGTTSLPLDQIVKRLSQGRRSPIKRSSASRYVACAKDLLEEIGSAYTLSKGTGGRPIGLIRNRTVED